MMTPNSYTAKAYEVIKDSISSAIFIDEKARSFFQTKDLDDTVLEQRLSVDLYDKFKKEGISLDVHKFEIGQENDPALNRYWFDGRDLVLLDWKLNKEEGEDLSLKLLGEIVNKPHIHFCAIYTSESGNDLDNVFKNILSYFSEETEEYYNSLKEEVDTEEEIKALALSFDEINLHRNDKAKVASNMKFISKQKKKITEITKEKDLKQAAIKLSIALMDTYKSDKVLPNPTVASFDNRILVINKTLVLILNKTENEPDVLLTRITEHIAKEKYSFTQLLGIEMRTTFKRSYSFIDDNLLKITPEAFFAHRTLLMNDSDDNTDTAFKLLIKDVLMEQASICLRNARLSLLDDSFLTAQSALYSETPDDEALTALNVFYNSININHYEGMTSRRLDFGDLFEGEDGAYYICITALCDCLRPNKIKNNYYFVEGRPIDLQLALEMGDTAFISFLPNNKVVSWILPEVDKKDDEKNNSDELSEEERMKFEIEKLKKINESLKHKPLYIKPQSYNVREPKIINNEIEIRRIETIETKPEDVDPATIKFHTVKYITTIKSNYTQRIANHAFAHPVRVGVDFVKKKR